MNEDEPFYIEDFIEISEALTSIETGKPFSHCVDCGTQLIEEGPPYLIQKALKGSEVLIEYAQCLSCYEELTTSYSKQTMSDLWNFFLDSCHFEDRKKKLLKESPRALEPWIENCLTCGKGRNEVSSYTLIGQCDGPHLLLYYLPYIICDGCQMRMHELMSPKSRDIWDRWYEDNIGSPPVMANDFTPGKVVLV